MTQEIQTKIIEVSPQDIIRGFGALQHIPAVSNAIQVIKDALADADIEVKIEVEIEDK